MPNTVELQGVLTVNDRDFIQKMVNSVKVAKHSSKEIEKSFDGVEKLGELRGDFMKFFAAEAVIEGAKSLVEFGRGLQDVSEGLTISTDALQGFSYAFAQGGANQEAFQKGMVKLNQSITGALDGDEKLIEAYGRLGVSFKDLETKSPEDVVYLIADGIKNAKNPTEALASAMEILGKSAYKLIPTFKEGAEELHELAKQAAMLREDEINDLAEIGKGWDAITNKAKVYGSKALLKVFGPGKMSKEMGENDKRFSQQIQDDLDREAAEKAAKAEPLIYTSPEGQRRPRKPNKDEEEFMDNRTKEEEEEAVFVEKDLQNRQRLYLEIEKINEDTWYLQRDAGRELMSDHELVLDLEKERVYWLSQAVRYENDIFGIHNKDAALARKKVAEIQKQISEVPRETESQAFTNSPRGKKLSPEEERQADLMNQFGAFKDFATGPFSSKGGLTTGGLTTGGLTSGGLGGKNDAYHLVRSGDRARAAAEAKKAKDPVEANTKATAESVANLAEKWGATGIRP